LLIWIFSRSNSLSFFVYWIDLLLLIRFALLICCLVSRSLQIYDMFIFLRIWFLFFNLFFFLLNWLFLLFGGFFQQTFQFLILYFINCKTWYWGCIWWSFQFFSTLTYFTLFLVVCTAFLFFSLFLVLINTFLNRFRYWSWWRRDFYRLRCHNLIFLLRLIRFVDNLRIFFFFWDRGLLFGNCWCTLGRISKCNWIIG
jgi:hypothetical protein